MKDYKINGNMVEIILNNDKIVKVSKKWVDTSIEKLDTDIEDVLLMYLEDNDILVNEEQEELNEKAKENKSNKIIDTKDKAKRKTPKERVQKENPTKEKIILTIAESLANLQVDNLVIENKGKIITFELNGENFKVDLVQKRKPKESK